MNKNDKKKSGLGKFLILFGAFALAIVLFASMLGTKPKERYLYSDIIGYFERLEVKAFNLDLGTGKLELQLRADAEIENNFVYNEKSQGLLSIALSNEENKDKATEKPTQKATEKPTEQQNNKLEK